MIPTATEEEVEQPGTATIEPPETTAAAPALLTRPNATIQAGSSSYKSHSLAARNWGEIGQSAQRLRVVSLGEARATFLRGLLDTPTDHPYRKTSDLLVSAAIHILIVAAVILTPLFFTQAIDLHQFAVTHLVAPPVPAAPPPPPPAAQAVRQPKLTQLRPSIFTAPSVVPKEVKIVKEEAPPAIETGGVVGGMPGGDSGGLLGGLLGGTGHVGEIAPPPPLAPARQVYRVGGQVKPPRLIKQVDPIYPLIAKKAHISGVVVIDAVIDEHGNVTEAHVVSGPGLLFSAALQAVSQWKYEPTYLNGEPVPLELEVNVTFHLLAGQ